MPEPDTTSGGTSQIDIPEELRQTVQLGNLDDAPGLNRIWSVAINWAFSIPSVADSVHPAAQLK